MSRGFVKEGDQEEVPMVLPRAFLPKGVPNYVTPEGLKLLQDEMESLKKEWTDAGSNYVTKNYIDAKMRLLSERINTAVLIDPAKANPDVVSFGMYVRYNDKVVRIVGVDEADASKRLISFVSPIAKSLIGKKKGDKFEIKVPRGTETIEVQEISRDASMLSAMTHIDTSENRRRQDNKTTSQQELLAKENVVSESELSGSQIQKKRLYNVPITRSMFPSSQNALGIGAASFWSEAEKDIAESPTAEPERHEKDNSQRTTVNSQSSPSSVLCPQFNPKVDITEFLPLVNEQGNIVGRALYCEIHNGNKVLHPAVHLLVYNSKKEIVGRYWWHVAFGENAEKTLKRKIKELEFPNFKPKFKKQYIRETKTEKELVFVFTATYDGAILPTPQGKEWDEIFRNS